MSLCARKVQRLIPVFVVCKLLRHHCLVYVFIQRVHKGFSEPLHLSFRRCASVCCSRTLLHRFVCNIYFRKRIKARFVIRNNYIKRVSSDFQTPRRELKIRRAAEYFLTKFEVFGNRMKHCLECDISSQSKLKLRSKRRNKFRKNCAS